jgi:hypothetical protein
MQPLASYKRVSAVALIVLTTLLALSAQTPAPPKYVKSSEVKVKGVVDEVKTAADGVVHLMLTTDKGPLDVMIAPEQFLKEMEISFAKGDKVEILGFQVLAEGAPLLLAREVTRNGDIMLMRDDFGKPVWLGWPK